MKGKIILMIGIVVLVGVVVFVSAYGYNSRTNKITLRIEKGWNLIPLASGAIIETNSQIQISDFRYGFIYDVDDYKQRLYMKDGKIINPRLDLGTWANDFYNLRSSIWVYFEKEGSLVLSWDSPNINRQAFDLSNYNLIKGWNFVVIIPEMFYEKDGQEVFSWNSIRGSCNLEKIYAWNPEEQDWMQISADLESFDFNDFIGNGMVVKVTKDCTLNEVGDSINPPQIPN